MCLVKTKDFSKEASARDGFRALSIAKALGIEAVNGTVRSKCPQNGFNNAFGQRSFSLRDQDHFCIIFASLCQVSGVSNFYVMF